MEQVEVFLSTKPDKAFVEVGLITSEPMRGADGNRTPLIGAERLIESIRKEAAKQGCDAVIVTPGAADGAYQGTCLVYK